MISLSLVEKDNGSLTKKFFVKKGELVKDSAQCFLSSGSVETVELEFSDLGDFLDGLKRNQAIIHGVSPHSPAKLVSRRLLPANPGAIARVKENFIFPDEGIMMFDYDPPANTTPLTKDELLGRLRNLHPELASAAMLWRPSSSSNIVGEDGKVYKGLANQRVYVEYRNPDNMDEFIANLNRIAWDSGFGHIFITAAGTALPRTFFDLAVFSPERLDFAAGADCGRGLNPWLPSSYFEPGNPVDLDNIGESYSVIRYESQVELAKESLSVTIEQARKEYKEAQADKLVGANADLPRYKAVKIVEARLRHELLPGDVIYTNDQEPISVRDIILEPADYDGMVVRDPLEPEYGAGKAKIFADDTAVTINSFAHGGRVFRVKLDFECYSKILEGMPTEELESRWLDRMGDAAMSNAQKDALAKNVGKRLKVGKTNLLKDMSAAAKQIKEERQQEVEDLSHHQIAEKLSAMMPKHAVATEGRLYCYNGENCWEPKSMNEIELDVARHFDRLPKCSRRSDYIQISKHFYTMMEEPDFFKYTHPVVATREGCWLLDIKNKVVVKRDHDPKYKVRFLLPFERKPAPMPMFTTFIEWAFEDEPAQVQLFQEVLGAILFGVLTRQYHKAILFRGGGANGKSTVLDIISGLIPDMYRTSVSPFQFSNPLYVAELAHKLVNTVAELEEGEKLPAAAFKTIVDSSMLKGRPIYEPPFDFPSTAAHIFSSNYPVKTTDATLGMKRRWLMFNFNNTIEEGERIPELGKVIVREEGSQIFDWAIKGLERLVQNDGKFTSTKANWALSGEMFLDADPFGNFLSDDDVVEVAMGNKNYHVKRAGLYTVYRTWCDTTGMPRREVLSKSRFNDRMEKKGFELKRVANLGWCWTGIRCVVT